MNNTARYELGLVKELGDGDAIIETANKEYHILLQEDEQAILEDMLLSDDMEFIAFDTKNEAITFENVFNMDIDNDHEELKDLDDGVDENGRAK